MPTDDTTTQNPTPAAGMPGGDAGMGQPTGAPVSTPTTPVEPATPEAPAMPGEPASPAGTPEPMGGQPTPVEPPMGGTMPGGDTGGGQTPPPAPTA